MNNHRLLSYQVIPDCYGQVRAAPLVLANELTTRLERWFQNCKFYYLAISNLSEETYNTPLQVRFTYSRRVSPKRDFLKIKADVTTKTDLLNYHQLVKIVHEFIEEFHKNYLALTEAKQGNNIISFENHINVLCTRFHKKNFPTKLDNIESNLGLESSLDSLKYINRVRNCLEHRSGIVSEKDYDPDKNYMSICWRYPKIISPDGEFTPLSGIKGRQNPTINFIDETKKFRNGERVKFDFYDNYKCIYTIITCFKKIIDALYNLLSLDQERRPDIIRDFNNV